MNDNFDPLDDTAILQLCLERDRLLSDTEFARSPSMCTLLRFLVDYKLSGSTTPLKAYTIAVDALGRDDSFDTQTDSYPRVQMGRLRRMLDNFYLREGGENRLSIAQNKYEIVLEPNEDKRDEGANLIGQSAPSISESGGLIDMPKPESEKVRLSPNFVRDFLGVCVLLLLMSIGAYFAWPDENEDEIDYPRITVEVPSGRSDPATGELAETIENHFIGTLKGFEFVRVYDARSNRTEKSDYVIKLLLLNPTGDRIELRLLDGLTDEILWSNDINAVDQESLQHELDKATIALVGHYGVIARTELSKRGNDYSVGYSCLLQFDQYFRYRQPDKLDPALQCLQKSAKRFPNDPYVLSMLAFANNMSQRFDAKNGFKGSGMELARRAESLDHDSAAANFAVAQSAFFEGDCPTGIAWGKRAVELNPLGSRISGYLGLYMLGCRNPAGEEYAARALDLDPNTDLAIAATLAFQMLKRGDVKGARAMSEKYMAASPRVEPGLELTYILSSAMLNDKKEARRMWKRMADRFDMPENSPPRDVLEKWIVNPLLINEIMVVFDEIELFDQTDGGISK